MNTDLRSLAWQTAERVFADLNVPIGTSFPMVIGIEVRKEEAIAQVRSELARAGLDVTHVEKTGWLFRRRWLLGARSRPQAIDRAQVERWLDTLEAALEKYDAALITWFPLVPDA